MLTFFFILALRGCLTWLCTPAPLYPVGSVASMVFVSNHNFFDFTWHFSPWLQSCTALLYPSISGGLVISTSNYLLSNQHNSLFFSISCNFSTLGGWWYSACNVPIQKFDRLASRGGNKNLYSSWKSGWHNFSPTSKWLHILSTQFPGGLQDRSLFFHHGLHWSKSGLGEWSKKSSCSNAFYWLTTKQFAY